MLAFFRRAPLRLVVGNLVVGAVATTTRLSSSDAISTATRGPVWQDLMSALSTPPSADEWSSHGKALVSSILGDATNADAVDSVTAARVFHLYLPIYFFCRERVRVHQASGARGAVTIGLSAPQGCGKTTLTTMLVERFAADGLTCVVASIDDFYLTGAEQDALAAAHPNNPLLQVRGNAGTHDLALGTKTLTALREGRADAGALRIPRYDKAARGGKGDRAPRDEWPAVSKQPDVVLLEGWMAGFQPVASDAPVLAQHDGLPEVNTRLARYAEWHELMDSWVVLAVDDPECVYTWRLQAEHAMAKAGRPGMSDTQLADFVNRYMPAYRAYLEGLYAAADAGGVDGRPTLVVQMDEARAPVARTR